MAKLFGKILRWALALVLLLAAIWIWGPRETPQWQPDLSYDLSDPEAFLAEREAQFDDITPGAEARIVWADQPGERTRYSVLYIHGFIATSEEVRPVPDRIAEALGANLVFARIRGHGRGSDPLEEARAGEWIEDASMFIDVARAVGNEVLIISNSNGGTLSAIAMTEPGGEERVAGIVFLSPNFALTHPAGRLFQAPWARHWLPIIAGRHHCLPPESEAHETYFTLCIPSQGGITVGAVLGESARRDYSDVSAPAFFLFAETDIVVSAQATREIAEIWGGPTQLVQIIPPDEGVDDMHHVLAGDIMSPALTDRVTDDILLWLYDVGIGTE